MTAKELEIVLEALQIAEYRHTVNDWAEGSEAETDDAEAILEYKRTNRILKTALRIVVAEKANARLTAELLKAAKLALKIAEGQIRSARAI